CALVGAIASSLALAVTASPEDRCATCPLGVRDSAGPVMRSEREHDARAASATNNASETAPVQMGFTFHSPVGPVVHRRGWTGAAATGGAPVAAAPVHPRRWTT